MEHITELKSPREFISRQLKLADLKERVDTETFNYLHKQLNGRKFSEFDRVYGSIMNSFEMDLSWAEGIDEDIIGNASEIESISLSDRILKSKKVSDSLKRKISSLLSEKEALIHEKEILIQEKASVELSNGKKDRQIEELREQVIKLQGEIQQNRIDEKIPGYVEGVKDKLKLDDKHFILMSYLWAGAGITFALGAIVAAFVTFFLHIEFDDLTTTKLIYIFSRGLLGIALLAWLSFVCLSNSKKYTHESIRRKDRQHALMFGEVFLQIYGSTATKEDATNVFKDWNMSGDSAFSDQTEQPPGIQSILSTLKDRLSSKEPPEIKS